MRTLKFIDMTLRQAGPSFGKELSFKEKLEIARSLDRLKADTIELAPISGSRADQLANRTIASMAVTRISAAVDISVGNIEETWESVRPAKKPKLNIIAPVSPVQMEYVCHKKAPAMLALIEEKVKEARFYSEYVEFSAVDATRAETGFLYQALNTAIDAGANKITVADTAGVMMPDEFEAFIKGVMENVPGLSEIELYVEISDSLNMALACADLARYDEAEELYHKALDTMRRIPGSELEQAVTLLNLADLQHMQDEEADVFPLLEEAEALLKTEDLPRDGYYAFVCRTCAPGFDYYGWFMTAKELREAAEKIYAGT